MKVGSDYSVKIKLYKDKKSLEIYASKDFLITSNSVLH